MRNFWSQMPMLRITLSFIAGIALEIGADYLHFSKQGLLPVIVLLVVALMIIICNWAINNIVWVYRLRTVNGFALSVMVLAFGYILTWFSADKNYQSHFQNYLTNESFIVARIIKPPLEKEKIVTVVAQVENVRNRGGTVKTTGNILINVLRDSIGSYLKYGDLIVCKSKIEEFEEPRNPEEFSFKLYQSFHNI